MICFLKCCLIILIMNLPWPECLLVSTLAAVSWEVLISRAEGCAHQCRYLNVISCNVHHLDSLSFPFFFRWLHSSDNPNQLYEGLRKICFRACQRYDLISVVYRDSQARRTLYVFSDSANLWVYQSTMFFGHLHCLVSEEFTY